MDFKNVVAVTNRTLCAKYHQAAGIIDPCLVLLEQIKKLAATEVEFIILREKDLPEEQYLWLAKEALTICEKANKKLVLHSFPNVAKELPVSRIHLPLWQLEGFTSFETLGVSVHSLEEAKRAQALGATYLTAGHIFETDCKKGLAGRGLSFLQEICDAVTIPVYGIGGIHEDNLASVLLAGATGGCMMSEAMKPF